MLSTTWFPRAVYQVTQFYQGQPHKTKFLHFDWIDIRQEPPECSIRKPYMYRIVPFTNLQKGIFTDIKPRLAKDIRDLELVYSEINKEKEEKAK